MNRIIHSLAICAFTLAMSLASQAQIRTPQPSPTGSFEQNVGLSTISMEYSRPGVKGRAVFGELVPFGKVWRTGANASTKITFSSDLMFGGKKVKAGTYALYTIPGKDEWTVMLYNDLSLGGNVAAYDAEKEYLRFTAKPQAISVSMENMTFMLNDFTDNTANLYLIWDKTAVVMPIEVEVDKQVMAQIDQVMGGPSANDYYAAAVYYYNTDRDMEQALEWIDKALAAGERYWVATWKARILGKMKNYKEATATAGRAKELAEEAKNMDFVKINEDLIAEFKKKM